MVFYFYNNKIHRIIGMSHIEAYEVTNEEEINKINKKKEKEFAKINKKPNNLEKDETCLLHPNLYKIGKPNTISNYVKKGKFKTKIPVKIIKNTNFGYYTIVLYILIISIILLNENKRIYFLLIVNY